MTARRAAAALASLAALAVLQQLVLPPLAERVLRGNLEQLGEVERVDVRALPAVRLLWRSADSIRVTGGRMRTPPARLADLLAGSRRVGALDLRVRALRVGPVTAREVHVVKRGDAVSGSAVVTDADLQAALPPGLDVRPVVSPEGNLAFHGTASFLGVGVHVRASVEAQGGSLVLMPMTAVWALPAVTVFADPRLAVLRLRARRSGRALTVAVVARLR